MENIDPYYKRYLSRELSRRCEKNSRYSLRSFAKSLSVDPATLSRVISGKKPLTLKTAAKMTQNMAMTPDDLKKFLESVADEYKSKEISRAGASVREFLEETPITDLPPDLFKVISDWYHAAILELTFVKDFKSDPRWISKSLGISITEAKLAIDRLKSLNYLKVVSGTLVKATPYLRTKYKNFTTNAHRHNQKQLLTKAIESLENDSIDKRSMSGVTIPIDPERVEDAKKMIREFTLELTKHMTCGERKRVYQLQVSFFPLQK